MISIHIIAVFLLLIRLVSIFYISRVIKRQYELFKLPVPEDIQSFRKILFMISLAILLGNLIPVIVDAVTLVSDVPRSPFLSWLSVTYAISNATTSLLSSLLIWFLYKIAEDSHK